MFQVICDITAHLNKNATYPRSCQARVNLLIFIARTSQRCEALKSQTRQSSNNAVISYSAINETMTFFRVCEKVNGKHMLFTYITSDSCKLQLSWPFVITFNINILMAFCINNSLLSTAVRTDAINCHKCHIT